MTVPPVPPSASRVPLARPLLWRLPLIVFLVIGAICLRYLDRQLQRDLRKEAVTQAVQTDALLESYMRQRIGLLHSVEVLMNAVATVPSPPRFEDVAREVFGGSRDVFAITYLDASGRVRGVYPADSTRTGRLLGLDDELQPARALALDQARRAHALALTPTLPLRDGTLGLVVYDPVERGGRLVGFVAGAFTYRSLFNDALAGQLQGRFAYRIRDEDGRVVAVSPEFPASFSSLASRAVDLPGGHAWRLDVPVPRFEPVMARLILWVVGLLLLTLVVFLVVREEQRAERFAAHSLHLELLSRDLLDANLRLEERAQQVAEANRAKSRFLANVSHELRTPLNAIVGYNGLAVDGVYGELAPALTAAHRRIGQAAEHLLALVDDVLDLSKIEVGRMRTEPESVDLRAMVDGVVTVVDPIASAKGVHIDVVLARDLPRPMTDPRHVRQILLNLASNAVKFTERGSVAIVVRRDQEAPERFVCLAVQDTGIGIAAADLERIFDEFEQVRPGGRGDSLQRGTGLGLTISRKLARLLGGDIVVQSTPGSGSRFTLQLPITPPVTTTDATTPPRSGPAVRPPAPVAADASAPAASTGDAPAAGWNPIEEATPPGAQKAFSGEGGSLDDLSGPD